MKNNQHQLNRMFWNYANPELWNKFLRLRKRKYKNVRLKGTDIIRAKNNEYD